MFSGVPPEMSKEACWNHFRRAATEYCTTLVSATEFDHASAFYSQIVYPLAELYAAGLQLPRIAPSNEDLEIEALTQDEWWELFKSIDSLTSDEDPYRTTFDPHADEEPVEAMLADDLADVYRDVLPATRWTDMKHLDDLLFELRKSFYGHWGRHALEALRAIHWRRSDWY